MVETLYHENWAPARRSCYHIRWGNDLTKTIPLHVLLNFLGPEIIHRLRCFVSTTYLEEPKQIYSVCSCVQQSVFPRLVGPNADPYPSTCRFCPVWLHCAGSSLQICISGYTVSCCIPICYCKSQHMDYGTLLTALEVFTTLMIKTYKDTLTMPSRNWASMESQRLLVVYPG